MISSYGRALRAAALGMSIFAVGCGSNGASALSPVGPTALTPGTTSLSSDAALDTMARGGVPGKPTPTEDAPGRGGNGGGSGGGNGTGEGGEAPERGRRDANNRVEVNGVIASIDAAARTITVIQARGEQVVVSVPVTAVLRHGWRVLTLADLAAGDRVQVKGTREEIQVVADEVKVEQRDAVDGGDDGDAEDDNDVKVTGVVSALTGTCPAVTFTVTTTVGTTTTTTSVAADATTNFHKVACAAVVNGAVVEVKGLRQASGSVLATKIEVEDAADDDDDVVTTVTVTGAVSALAGTCPAVTFTVTTTATPATTTSVTSGAATDFTALACAAIADGGTIKVTGTLQAGGSVLATKVETVVP
jgi:hypothetical protein